MKDLKELIIVLESPCLIGIVICTIMYFSPLKKTGVDYILSALDLEIPQYEITSSNEDWECGCGYDYDISFSTDYAASIIQQFENRKEEWNIQGLGCVYRDLECKYDETECYFYLHSTDNTVDDYHYFASIYPQKGIAHLWMGFEFGEHDIWFLFILILTFVGLVIGLIYGMIILAVKVSNSISARKRPKDNQA